MKFVRYETSWSAAAAGKGAGKSGAKEKEKEKKEKDGKENGSAPGSGTQTPTSGGSASNGKKAGEEAPPPVKDAPEVVNAYFDCTFGFSPLASCGKTDFGL